MSSEKLRTSRLHYYHMANDVLMGNFAANAIGGILTEVFISHRFQIVSERFISLYDHLNLFTSILNIILVVAIIVTYEQPIRKCLKNFHLDREQQDTQTLALARKRIQNLNTDELYPARLSITGTHQLYLPTEIQKMLEGARSIRIQLV